MIDLCDRRYALPARKTVVFCVDGCAPEYLDQALADGQMPRLAATLAGGGLYVRGRGQIPSFTNPNNVSIVTGQPARVHGISGNYYFDAASGEEVPMNDPRFLRAPTLFEKMEQAGVRTLCITAKDKLRALLGACRDGGPRPISLSAEKAHEQALPEHGIASITAAVGRENPSIYDWDISHYAMEMGLALHERVSATLLYVSLTDYVQHKEPPRGPMSDRFYARFDALFGAYLDAGFVCGITADHGMNDKTAPDGSPNVRYLEDALREAGLSGFRVLLPITDPYVVHHGALGSYATVYVSASAQPRAAEVLARLPGVELVLPRDEAARRFELPPDRIGDLVILGDRSTVLGKSAAYHDLSAVRRGLRSHGGLHEADVPILASHPLRPEERARLLGADADVASGRPCALSNADVFDLLLNRLSIATA
ncbi:MULTISPECIES: phosphonoacetate hydrolase [Sorangium]|uniref:Phosphonoacetate hydrolase n=1 Tax=Sorangium cellulosum TaxID=56 RepID=A0A4P2QMJ2_SORCE|nr:MULTISPECIES: phosphonoacetate hydrolase [Sorangium]AUX31096.1 phosphonoacetate hydrolase [Sorangium cellulosum]WCQ90476.1 Phosphonoacetate hydrolase [Sorangium sp. Soce836]